MKAILAFAVFAIAAQAMTPAYFQGFTDQLGFTNEQMNRGAVCFNSFQEVIFDIHRLIGSPNVGVSEVLRSAITLFEDVEHKLKVDCGIYINDIAYTLLRNAEGSIQGTALRNFNRYGAEVIQQIALYVDYLKAAQHYEAGKTEAYIYQILLGLEKPKVNIPEFDYNQYVPMNITKYITEFTKSYLETLGFDNNKAIKDNVECSFAQISFIEKFNRVNFGLNENHNTSYKLATMEKMFHEFVQLHEACVDAFEFNFQNILVPIARAFKVAPVHATLTVLHNLAINLPELRNNHVQMIIDLQTGKYTEAGAIYAEQLITLVTNIMV